ncbi:unnamed protein product [Chrysoparadoxa australica]
MTNLSLVPEEVLADLFDIPSPAHLNDSAPGGAANAQSQLPLAEADDAQELKLELGLQFGGEGVPRWAKLPLRRSITSSCGDVPSSPSRSASHSVLRWDFVVQQAEAKRKLAGLRGMAHYERSVASHGHSHTASLVSAYF